MKSRILPSLSLLAALRLFGAETPGDYFHEGATNYVFTKTPEARRAVEAGLQKYPDDVPLQKLLELLKQQENQQPQNNQDQKQDQNKDQQQKPQDQKKPQDQQQKNDPQQGDQKKDQESKKPDPKDAEQKQGSEDKDRKPQDQGDSKDQDKAQAGRMSAMQMTPQQAQQLLDAHKGEENIMIFLSPEQKGTNRLRGKIRDW